MKPSLLKISLGFYANFKNICLSKGEDLGSFMQCSFNIYTLYIISRNIFICFFCNNHASLTSLTQITLSLAHTTGTY